MRKIRGFKLKLRVKEIQRRAKKARLDLVPLGLGNELELQGCLDAVAAKAVPAVLYDSFSADEAGTLSPMPGLACSLAIATLGPDLDAFSEGLAPEQAPLFKVVASAAEAVAEVVPVILQPT